MEQRCTPDTDASLRLVRARDYFQLVLDEFEDVYHVRVSLSTTADEADHTGAVMITIPSRPVPGGVLAALQVTLHNWACMEMSADLEGVKKAKKLFDASRQVGAHIEGFTSLGWPWEAVQSATSAVQAVMQCDFAAAEAASRKTVELIGASEESQQEASNTASIERTIGWTDDIELLQALAYYTLGIATESSAYEESLKYYEEAIAHISRCHNAGPCQSVMRRTHEQLALYVEEERRRERMRIAVEEATLAAHMERKGQNATRLKKAPGSGRRAVRKASSSWTSVSGQPLSPIVIPSVPEPLQRYLAVHGLSTLVSCVCNAKDALNALGYSLPGYSAEESLPTSPFTGTHFEACEGEPIFGVLLCTSTPLQWTLRLLEAASQPSTTLNRSVWSPQPTLAPLLTELAAQRPPGPKSALASQTRKEIAEGNTKLRYQVLQLFAPPPASSKVKQNAHESVDTVVQLLGQRLGVLLKTERAFEDQWLATERVLSALKSYAASQDLMRLKRKLMSQQRLRQIRYERSACTIVHFFRDIVGKRAWRVEQAEAGHQLLAAREKAAIVLQKYVRRWLACQESRRRANERAAYVRKILVVQGLARMKFAKAAYDELRKATEKQKVLDSDLAGQAYAALQIQRVYRGHCARLRCYHLRGLTHEETLHHFRNSRHYYATVIQKRARGMLVRRQWGRAVYARRCYGRNVHCRRLLERSCVVIQRAFRAHRLRRARTLHVVSIGEDLLLGGAAFREQLSCGNETEEHAGSADENVAAHCIQDAYRSCVARRRLEALKYARAKEVQLNEQRVWTNAPPFSLKECVF
ncbi:hypothetical protein ABL78_7439 [Leptomonas seymouri]|uniref:Uncharacterized protein n=1 Tax=Leptomonas seymouri TaxID=5684 RepID=A0A0N1HSD4_LEPSE|nr:hypothetical protein ABL78_7439 [Leptomonas seymouri]|eukprot:KPI83523.1 hypothetical protein ABL78_7439 [Leptomonas seymouri]